MKWKNIEKNRKDLIDNSISAKADKIEILVDTDTEPFKLFLADNGEGMTEDELKNNMQFPSNSPENSRLNSVKIQKMANDLN